MRRMFRLALVGGLVATIAGAAAIGVFATSPPDHANKINVTFHETPVAITDRTADLGIRQIILTSTWTLDGFGLVSDVTSVTQDTAVHPCGAGSSSEVATRRIVSSGGTLVLREGGIQCITASGPVFNGTYAVDVKASTGVFAGAEGSGTVTVQVARSTTLSGRLKLAQ
jgi:hypothetical protein